MFASIFEGFLNELRTFFTAAEYNPFHNGHQYQVQAMRQAGATHVAAVMSGSFVQRGEPALLDPYLRAQAAVRSGVDLVLSLPLPWAVAPAERFAFGAAFLAVKSGAADGFSFGCECDAPSLLLQTAQWLANQEDELRQQSAKRTNCSYPSLLSSVLPQPYGAVLQQPNNILGVEYIKSLKALGFSGEIFPVRRTCEHDGSSPSGVFASASFLRSLVREGKDFSAYVPPESLDVISQAIAEGRVTGTPEKWERQILSVLRLKEKGDFSALPFVGGGLEDRLYRAVRQACNLQQLYAIMKSKRFTHASVRRLTIHAVLGVPDEFCRADPPYLRVLAVGKGGNDILRKMRESAKVPVIQKRSDVSRLDFFAQKVYALECRAGDFYNLLTDRVRPCGTEMTDQIFRIGEKE